MRAILIGCTLLTILPVASANTDACAWQTSLDVGTCATAATFSQGNGDCSTSGSVAGGYVNVGIRAAGQMRGVSANNVCYAFAGPDGGYPYEGSQLALQAWEQDDDGYSSRGAYLNSGTVHADGRDHEYCYVTTFTQNGEDADGPRVDCPAKVPVPVLLGALP